MRFRGICRFEVGHLLRRPSTWIYTMLLVATALLLVKGGANPVGTGTVFNAPAKLATFTLFLGMIGTLVTAALFVDAGTRDARWRMESLFHTAPLRTRDYLGGRFAGALLVNALLLLSVPLALLLGAALVTPGPASLGPFRPEAYVLPYVLFLVPNMFVNATVLFGISVLSRRSLPGYLGGLALMAVYMATANLAGGNASLALVDPTGALALMSLTEGWTRVELDTRLIGFTGAVLWNRVIWTAVAAAMLAFTLLRFRAAHPESGRRRARWAERRRHAPPEAHRTPEPASAHTERQAPVGEHAVAVPRARRSFGLPARLRQTLAVAGVAFRQVVRREFALVALGLGAFAVLMGMETNHPIFGTSLIPLTAEVAADLTGRTVRSIIALLTVFYAGELVWNDRDAGIHRIGDSLPVPDWVPFTGRFLALAAMLVMLQSVLMLAGIAAQALQGHFAFQPRLYVQMLYGLRLPDYLLFAALALLVHVVVNQKYLAHVVAVLLFYGIQQAGMLGIEHRLLIYGSDPGWTYSALNGFGAALEPFLWFKLYWAAGAVLLATVALLFWVRGEAAPVGDRLRRARERLPRVARVAAAALAVMVGTGGFIFYNTNMLNEYRTGLEAESVLAEYERRYKRYEHLAQPWVKGMHLEAHVFPDEREATVRGTYLLVNRTDAAIDSVHLSSFPDPRVTLHDVRFDREAGAALEDAAHGYRIYALADALQPGDSLVLHFEVRVGGEGFRNTERVSANTPIVGEFTHLPSALVLPAIGYRRELLELSAAAARRRHGLDSLNVQPSVDDFRARNVARMSPNVDWVDFEATVSTDPRHTAVFPGTLLRTWLEDGRRWFHYRAGSPINTSFALLSAAYAVHDGKWRDVVIQVLHQPDHAFNVRRMDRHVSAALEYFTREFGPYPHTQFRMVEFPRYGNFGRAYPGMMVYTENNAINLARTDAEQSGDIDGALIITAHELAHQWWGQRVLGADVQGASVLSETLAQYSAAMVLERTHGEPAARSFVRSMHFGYLEGRGSHATPEVPLILSADHEYIHYRKGPVVLYALRHYLGEERVNGALRSFYGRFALRGPPYATTRDLYAELRAVTPDTLQYLLEDLFTTITLWDLRATRASARPAAVDGHYEVELEVTAAKLRADGAGSDRPIAMNDPVEIGVFAEDGAPLYLRHHRIGSGTQTISITVPARPARAGIDPYHRLITRQPEGLIGAKFVQVEHGARPAGP